MKLDEALIIDDNVRHFIVWALEALGISKTTHADTVSSFEIPQPLRSSFQGARVARLSYGGADRSHDEEAGQLDATEVTTLPVDGTFLVWLMDQLHAAPYVPCAVTTLPALRVHEISTRLFQAYTVEGGSMHLSGCTLEDRPVLRQSWLAADDTDQLNLVHRFVDAEGATLSEAEVAAMGLQELKSPSRSLPRLGQDDVRNWCEVANRRSAADQPLPARAPTLASVIWCPYAAGKIEFVIGDSSAELAFAGWAQQVMAGLVEAPMFVCPETGIASHTIAATEDGQVTCAEAIQVCAQSGKRVLVSELETCDQTGERVLPEFLVNCPVSQQRVLETKLIACTTCEQPVSPACIKAGVCSACRTMQSVRKDDPRMARVLGEYPRLDRWRNWRIGETSTSYVLVAAALIKRILVVVNKDSLEMVRLATRNRFSSHWSEPPLTDQQELLRD